MPLATHVKIAGSCVRTVEAARAAESCVTGDARVRHRLLGGLAVESSLNLVHLLVSKMSFSHHDSLNIADVFGGGCLSGLA